MRRRRLRPFMTPMQVRHSVETRGCPIGTARLVP